MSKYDQTNIATGKKRLHCAACGVVSPAEKWLGWHVKRRDGDNWAEITLAACPTCGTVRVL